MSVASCLYCDQSFEPEAFLRSTTAYGTATDSGVAPCPGCGKQLEFRVRSNILELGYSYWSGSFHFEAVSSIPTAHLKQSRSGSTVTLSVAGQVLYSGSSS